MTTTGITTGTTPLATTVVPSTTTPLSSTAMLTSTTTTTLLSTTTTMNYCAQRNGMNQPLTIQPSQVTFDSPSDQSPSSTDINPTSTTPGFTFTTPNPEIIVTLYQPTTLTVIYLPNDRPNQPSNVKDFAVVFTYPNGTTTTPFTSTTVSASTAQTSTTTPLAGTTSGTTTVVPPSNASSQLNLPPNFDVPETTTITIRITSTTDELNPTGVCVDFLSLFFLKSKSYKNIFRTYIMSENRKRETARINRSNAIFMYVVTIY